MNEDSETRLRRTQNWVQSLVETTQDAVITIDARSAIVLFNAAAERVFGYSWAQVRGQDVAMLMPEPYGSEHAGYITRYERTGEPHAIGCIRNVTGRRANGEEFPVELSVTEIDGGDGEVRYGAFIRDISDKEQLHRELLERERLAAIGTTAAKFAHEISNPLNGMYTQAQLMLRRIKRDPAVADARIGEGLALILNDIEHLNSLLVEFRSMSRREEYRLRPMSLATLATDISAVERAGYAQAGIVVELDLPAELPRVIGDPLRLRQVLTNLIRNAAEAMPGGGIVHLRAAAIGHNVELTVTDGGPGLPDGLDLFAPFTTTKDAGTGLGLAIVSQIMAAHNGAVRAESAATGAVFTIELPIAVY